MESFLPFGEGIEERHKISHFRIFCVLRGRI